MAENNFSLPTNKVLSLGIAVADTFAKPINKFPKWNTLDTFSEIKFSAGGCAVNTGINLKNLGLDVGVAAAIGNDKNGKYILEELKKKKIYTETLVKKKINTAYTFAMISSEGKRRYLTNWGANDYFLDTDIKDSILKKYGLIHLCGTFAMKSFDGPSTAKLLKRAKKLNLVTCMDTIYNDKVDCVSLLKSSIPYLDIFFPSYEEAILISGFKSIKKNMDFLKKFKIPIVGIKMGEQGSIVSQNNLTFLCPSFKIPVVDTSGAGDAFMSGLIFSIVKKFSIEESIIFATGCAALSVGQIGANEGIPKPELVKRFIEKKLNTSIKKKNFIKYLD